MSIKTRSLVGVAVLGVSALALSACGSTSPDGSSEGDASPITIKVSSGFPESNNVNQALMAYADAVEAETDSRIEFEFYFSGSLHPLNETSAALADGVVDFTAFLPLSDANTSKFPFANWAASLTTLAVPTFSAGYFGYAAAQIEWASEQEALQSEMERSGIKTLGNPPLPGAYEMMCTTPVTNLAEAEGKRIRVPGDVWDAQVKALGMVPQRMAGSEIYEALQRGVLDCTVGSPDYFQSSSLYEVAKHYTAAPLAGYGQSYLAFGLDFWNSLTEADQQLLWDASEAYYENLFGTLHLGQVAFFESAAANGVEIYEPATDMLAAIEESGKAIQQDLIETAPSSIDDPAGAIDDLRMLNDQWYERSIGEFALPESLGYVEWLRTIDADGLPDYAPYLDALSVDVVAEARP